MKQAFLFLTCFALCGFNSFAQEKLSGRMNTGLIIPFNDFSKTDYWGDKPDMFLSAGLSYEIARNLSLRGDLTFGNMDGDNKLVRYETSFYEGDLQLSYNIIPLFGESRYKFNIYGGAGLMLYYSRLYDSQSRIKILESPVPSEKHISPNAVISGGVEVGIPLADNWDLNIGFSERAVLNNDWMDGLKSGDADDFYGFLSAGFTFYLKDAKDPSKVEIDKGKYNQMIRNIDSLSEATGGASQEDIAKLEMESEEKDIRIRMLENKLDSARAQVASVETDNSASTAPAPNEDAILGAPQYRIIVASLPSRTMAQRWIDRSQLDKSEMVIAHIEDLNTYRVVYKSFSTVEAAKKEKQTINSIVPDAWIIKF